MFKLRHVTQNVSTAVHNIQTDRQTRLSAAQAQLNLYKRCFNVHQTSILVPTRYLPTWKNRRDVQSCQNIQWM